MNMGQPTGPIELRPEQTVESSAPIWRELLAFGFKVAEFIGGFFLAISPAVIHAMPTFSAMQLPAIGIAMIIHVTATNGIGKN